jgi:hypothetical protein
MNPITKQPETLGNFGRWGVRSIEAFTAEELALLQQKVAGWVQQRMPSSRSHRRRVSFLIKPRTPKST